MLRDLLHVLFQRRAAPGVVDSGIVAGLPFEVIAVPGQAAVRERERLLALGDVTPVILGDEADVTPFVDALAGREADIPGILHDAVAIDLQQWLHERWASDPDSYSVAPAPWPQEEPPKGELSVPLEVLTRRPKKTVLIGLFPTTRPWEVPAHVRYGGFNACPTAEVHVAWHRHWYARWGAVIASMSGDVIECTVSSPPKTREEALALAREHMLYCPDIVHQGTQSVEGLAAALLGAGTWYFWWD